MKKLSRRRFLQATAAVTAAAGAAPSVRTSAFAQQPADQHLPWPENGTLVPDEGWRLWLDTQAQWASDDIFLPEDVSWIGDQLCGKGQPLPVNAPTGGWTALTVTTGKQIILPTSVEQHFWGQHGAGPDGKPRPYTPEEYRYAADTKGGIQPVAAPADDAVPQNGAYFGVSWWFRPLEIPLSMDAKRIFLHIRGAHLRAEVYLNGQLCGYSIMEELPFEADLTRAAKPGGENHLAIRITNPFGRFDWVDGSNAKWGNISLFRSHGFGALDRGITLSAHEGKVRIADLWVLNTPAEGTVVPHLRLEHLSSDKSAGFDGTVSFEILDPKTRAVLASETVGLGQHNDATVIGPATGTSQYQAQVPVRLAQKARWDIGAPNLYLLRATFTGKDHKKDSRIISFGFRTFAPTGLGSNAMFRLNGKRIKLYSSISWGFWGLNGMFPVPELAEKEVRSAQALGLNCLNFHRNLPKEDVLRWHDRLGVLRYMEPGGGKLAIGKLPANVQANAASIVMERPTSDADKFAQRFMHIKCVEMVKAFRSHPSVIIYCLQNELGADLKNPDTLAILKAMHDEDPSRIVELNDGFEERGAAQAWYEPWDDNLHEGKLHRSDETPFGDFWNNHQGAGDQWYDEFYQSPAKFTYKSPQRDILSEFGEMEGCARPDNHALMVHQLETTYKRYSGPNSPAVSYDLDDHKQVLAAYDKFLNKWGFRKGFPTAEGLFTALGRTCYDTWQNYMENARISDELDFAVISGWESTAIENHSGIVDNLRNPKADPKIIGDTLQPVRPIAKQRAMTIELGKPATFDLYLANDTGKSATGMLTFSMVTPSGKLQTLTTLAAPAQTPDQFSYLLKEAFTTPPLVEEGLYRFKFFISSVPLSAQTKELWVARSIYNAVAGMPFQVRTSGLTAAAQNQFKSLGALYSVADWNGGKQRGTTSVLVTSGYSANVGKDADTAETTGESLPVMKPGQVPEPGETAVITREGHVDPAVLEAVRGGTPLLILAQSNTLADGVAKQLAAAGAFTYTGLVGDVRAPWMGNWYFVREHPLYAGMPVNQPMGKFYQAKGRQSNGMLVEGPGVEIVTAYSRDHDRVIGAGTFTCRLGKGRIVFHRCPDFHPVLQQRFLANAIAWLTGRPS